MSKLTISKAAEIKNGLEKAVEYLNKAALVAKEVGADLKRIPGISGIISFDYTNEEFRFNEPIYKLVLCQSQNGNKTLEEQLKRTAILEHIEENDREINEAIKGL
ncbi:MAG: hypothetical protein Q4G23_08040 [Clostridia bacterium]|nr:hypothetical protein [Clostridia bacterium]